LNRVEKQAAPGEDWKLDSNGDDHSIAFGYMTNNTSDNIALFDVNTSFADNTFTPVLVKNGIYANGELYKTVTKDENHSGTTKNHTTEEFTDKQGMVVLKRTYADVPGETQAPHDTYYVYDDFGNLTYVLPPKIEASTATLTEVNNALDELGYQYVYDHRNRLVEKQIPGKEKEYIVYNKLDQPILTQDANQRGKSPDEWLFTKYDAFGRVAYTGKATSTDGTTRTDVQESVDNHPLALWATPSNTGTHYDTSMTPVYYNNASYPNNTSQDATLTEVLTVNYYDDYR